MTTLREAAQQALEALDEAATFHRNLPDQHARRLAAMTALRAALAEPVQEPVQEPVAYKSDTVCALCAREIALEAETAPFGCVTVRRLSLRHENHADQYQFYPAGQSPYLDNVDECHTVYTVPPQRKENT